MRIVSVLVTSFLWLPCAHTALAAGSDSQPEATARDPAYDNAKKAIDAKNWKLALVELGRAVANDSGNADIHNYLGYAYRKSGNLDAAFKSYAEALRLDPKHKGAHEYVGEAYLMVNNLAKAEEHLTALNRICFFPCEEYRDLKKEIEEYKKKRAGK